MKNRMTILSVGCDVGLSHVFSTSTFKVKGNEPSVSDTIQMQCVSTWVLLASKMKGT